MKIALRDFADPGNLAHVQRRKKTRLLPRHDPQNPVRLGLIRSNFRDHARRSDTDGAVQIRSSMDCGVEFMRGGERRPVQALGAGKVEIGFVDRGHFDRGSELLQHFEDPAGVFAIAFAVAFHKDRLRTHLVCCAQGHGRMHAEFSRGVGCGGDHSAFVESSHPTTLACTLERRIEKFLDGNEEGVHVEVEKRAAAYGRMAMITRGIPAKSGLVSTLVHSPSIAPTRAAANQPISRIRWPPGLRSRAASGIRRR